MDKNQKLVLVSLLTMFPGNR